MACLPSGNATPSNSSNPFASLINSQIHTWYTDLIDSLLVEGGATTLVRLTYVGRWEDCAACTTHSGLFQPGGSTPYQRYGKCLVCGGSGKVQVKEEEDLYVCVELNAKKFMTLSTQSVNIDDVDMEIMARIDILPKFLAAEFVTVKIGSGTCQMYDKDFIKSGSAEACGFGPKQYFIMPFKRFNNTEQLIDDEDIP